ncbi:hypothetical protein HID58_007331 [Brassica napus]|uniref:Uncharacterized protein n=1 Tax=Brassica napus TaxID=3708 RepID=A0ABQ8EE30_BRANA|nr:hypothetical protein HID58_007331 [Brassica napus]
MYKEGNMDACFLTSRSISGVKDIVPFTKARIYSCPKRSSGKFLTRKVAAPISPLESDTDLIKDCVNKSKADADWKEFRARLVAGEQAATSDMVVDCSSSTSSRITLGDKWAHKISEPEPGCLLVATEKLDGVHIYEKTVVLILSVGPSDTIGVILNRPSLMSIKGTKSTVLDKAGTFSDKRLFFGGPLEERLFLVSPRNGEDNEVEKSGVFRQVMKGLESVGLAAEMVKRNLVGRSELGNEQLKADVLRGYWTVAACSSSVVELGSAVQSHGLWDEVVGLIGPQSGSAI